MQLKRPPNQQHYGNHIIDNCIGGFNLSTQADNWLAHKLETDPGYLYEDDTLISCPMPNKRNVTGAPCFYSLDSQREFARYHRDGSKHT